MSFRRSVTSSAIPYELTKSPGPGLLHHHYQQCAAGGSPTYTDLLTDNQGLYHPQLTETAAAMQCNEIMSDRSLITPWLHRPKPEQECIYNPESKPYWQLMQAAAAAANCNGGAEMNYENHKAAVSLEFENRRCNVGSSYGEADQKFAAANWLQMMIMKERGHIIKNENDGSSSIKNNDNNDKIQMSNDAVADAWRWSGRAMQMVMEAAGLHDGAGSVTGTGRIVWTRPGCPGGHNEEKGVQAGGQMQYPATASATCRKRKRSLVISECKADNAHRAANANVESQRMNHITVERNRRKQMNHHLAVIRSLMPPSYVQRGDQASIIGGAIEFVKELEHVVHSLRLEKQKKEIAHAIAIFGEDNPKLINFYDKNYDHPQQSNSSNISDIMEIPRECTNTNHEIPLDSSSSSSSPTSSTSPPTYGHGYANVEVKFFGSTNALIKVVAPKAPHQLFHVLSGFHNLQMKIVHLNISTMDHIVLYIFNVQVQDAQYQNNDVNHIISSVKSIFNYVS